MAVYIQVLDLGIVCPLMTDIERSRDGAPVGIDSPLLEEVTV